jgi:hypothetical protein
VKSALAGRRGTALVEFVVALPFLAMLIALTFFLGFAMGNRQQVIVAARHAAWSQASGSPAPSAGQASPSASGSGPRQTPQDLVAAVGSAGGSVSLAQALFIDTFPGGSSASVSTEFATSVAAWQQFRGAISASCAREGGPWMHGQADCIAPLGQQYLMGLDQALQQLPAESQGFAKALRDLYQQSW